MSTSASISYQQLDALVTPILMTLENGLYNQRTEYSSVIAEKQGEKKQFQTVGKLYGMGNAVGRAAGDNITYDQSGLEYMVNFYYQIYSLAFAIPEEAIDDGQGYNLLTQFTDHLGQAMTETREWNGVNMFNYAFNPGYTQTGGDGQSLISASHPTISDGNQSNLLNVSSIISQSSIEQMLIQIRRGRDPRGKYINLKPKNLIVAPAQMYNAQVIMKSILRSDTATNAINPIEGSLGIHVLSRLTSDYAWFIQTEGAQGGGLTMYWRDKVKRAKESDFNTNSLRVKVNERYGMGWVDWRCIFGSPGV